MDRTRVFTSYGSYISHPQLNVYRVKTIQEVLRTEKSDCVLFVDAPVVESDDLKILLKSIVASKSIREIWDLFLFDDHYRIVLVSSTIYSKLSDYAENSKQTRLSKQLEDFAQISGVRVNCIEPPILQSYQKTNL